jgi:hypothetical protein
MSPEEQEFLFGVYGTRCDDLPEGPQLDKVIRVIKDHPSATKMELWNVIPLPKGMNYSAFSNILCALEKKKMISIDSEDHVSWVAGSPG